MTELQWHTSFRDYMDHVMVMEEETAPSDEE